VIRRRYKRKHDKEFDIKKGVIMYAFFDVETDGLPKNYNAPVTDVDNWPRIVQIAWAIYDRNAYLVNSASYIISQDGRKLPKSIIIIHGIRHGMVDRYGEPAYNVMREFDKFCLGINIEYLIAHNIKFDLPVVEAERVRLNLPIRNKKLICTMRESTNYCELPDKRGYKWPKLQELHVKLFGRGFEGSHNAMIDVFATAKCFFALKKKGVIKCQ
jgi:DNA polymerase III epsilon subunit-like protein